MNRATCHAGTVGILNVGAGDIKVSFDPSNPAERIRAARIVKDMLRRGYALLVDAGDGKYVRAHDFDESCCCYIVADFDPTSAQPETEIAESDTGSTSNGTENSKAETDHQEADGAPAAQRKRGRPRLKKLAAESTHAVAVARTAGG